MSASSSVSASRSETGSVLDRLVEELTNRIQAGEPVDPEEFLAQHPEHADRIRQLLPALEVLADLGRSAARGIPLGPEPGGETGVLGDFRILREIGRGGMGVVYEAEQISLGRRVALKVLPFAAALDPRQLQRFKVEAQAAAQLHHTHIVPVFSVGVERGVHYYAMQFIDGRPLSWVIRELASGAGPGDPPQPPLPRGEARKKPALAKGGDTWTLPQSRGGKGLIPFRLPPLARGGWGGLRFPSPPALALVVKRLDRQPFVLRGRGPTRHPGGRGPRIRPLRRRGPSRHQAGQSPD
jgi:hypothetical protein